MMMWVLLSLRTARYFVSWLMVQTPGKEADSGGRQLNTIMVKRTSKWIL
jgi:hypothetical protein